MDDYEKRYSEMADEMFRLPSVANRFERTGVVTEEQARLIGAVGMAARTCNVKRDIRASHPFEAYKMIPYEPAVLDSGDVMARALLRKLEIDSSLAYIRNLLALLEKENRPVLPKLVQEQPLKPDSFLLSLSEGWRGEIAHVAVTDSEGKLAHYKVKDPSMHNWFALALAVRNNEISDFPICNKSFDLSYCGHDL
jgi:Ni,Fe-hydrogenase III large subunit